MIRDRDTSKENRIERVYKHDELNRFVYKMVLKIDLYYLFSCYPTSTCKFFIYIVRETCFVPSS